MTGVNTAMPTKFGLVTVLSRIKPPTLEDKNNMSINERRGRHHTYTKNINLTTEQLVAGIGESINPKNICVSVKVNEIWASLEKKS